jgi:transcriptional regulator with XRE-family HTH domain
MLNRALRLIRQFHRYSQTELARKLGLSNSYLSEIESGLKKPGLDVLEKYSIVFNIPVSSILLFSEQMDTGTKGAKLKFGATNKVLQILEWIAATDTLNSHAGN